MLPSGYGVAMVMIFRDGGRVVTFCELGVGHIWFGECLWWLVLLAVFFSVLADWCTVLLVVVVVVADEKVV